MRVTIIADDGVVGIDGEFRTVDLSALDPDIHAVHWDSVVNEGEIEYKSPRREEAITDFAPYQPFVGAWSAAAPPPLPPSPPPLTKAQLIDDVFTRDPIEGLLGEVADLKGVTESQLIADIKMRRGA